jgi:type IV pilus assembly protein PilA
MKRLLAAPRGFTLLELMVVVAVIAILSTMMIPSYRDRIVRQQVAETLDGLAFARGAIATRYAATATFPADNVEAGLPPPDKIVSGTLSSVTVADGALVLVFGNTADSALKGKRLSLRPAFVDDYPQVPLVWLCAAAPVPGNMTAQGDDVTDVPRRYLPLRCQDTAAKPG